MSSDDFGNLPISSSMPIHPKRLTLKDVAVGLEKAET